MPGTRPGMTGWRSRALATFVTTLALTSAAHADLKLCNRMSYVVEAAIGVDSSGATATRGWLRIDPAQCRVVLQGALNADKIMLNARVLPLYGASPLPQNGTDRLCVAEDNFVIAAARQCRGSQTLAAFTEIKPTDTEDGNKIAYLAEDSDYDDEQAKLAAIQRLLLIAGYDASPIDGVDGPKTRAALSAFLKSRGLKPEIVDAPDFFDVIIKAVQQPSGGGLTWCNDTRYKIMAAVAEDDGKTITSRGWYGIAPGQCQRPDLGTQPKRVFSFAEAVDGSGRPVSIKGRALNWGGGTLLCTRDSKFEIGEQGDCAGRGLTATGFAAVDLSDGKPLRFTAP
uniref:Peptidoglycan binding-like domain-containing protein n=1 Tax=Rhodopseudomonas palustris (strain DX-1) TaxID=652103 RepID=E6VMG2_RHOPX